VIGRRKRKGATAELEPSPPADLPPRPQAREVTRFGHGSRVPGWDDAVDLEKDPAEIPDPATTPVPVQLRGEIEAHMAKYPDFRSAAIPALAAAQRHHGWCSPEAIVQAACVMRLTPGYLISVASFYDMLETHPVGRNSVYVCTNISCSLCGADELFQRLQRETEGDADINLRSFECLGACDIAPMASVNGIYVGPIAFDEVPKLVEQIRAGVPPLPNKQLHLRKSTDPNAVARALPPTATPDPPSTSYGPPMGGEVAGPPAPIELPPQEQS
jgi:NADH:ubiquinone oxidoreductase subunit E